MAIWQFRVDFFPSEAIIKTLGHIPDRLPNQYLPNRIKPTVDNNNYSDAATEFWKGCDKSEFKELISELTYTLPEVEWLRNSTNVYSWGNSDANDLTLSFAENNTVESFNCRIDLHDLDEVFIEFILELCKSRQYVMADTNRNIRYPDRLKLSKLMANSHAANFVADPNKFIRDFDAGKQHPDKC